MGMILFSIKGVTDVPLGVIIRGCIPIIICMTLLVLTIYYFPQLALWLPSTMF